MQGAIVKLRRAILELCSLNLNQCWDGTTVIARGQQAVFCCWEGGREFWRGIWASGSGYNKVLALEVLNVVDGVEPRRHTKPPLSASASRTVSAALSFQARLRVCICTCCGVGGNCTRQVFCTPVQTSIYTGQVSRLLTTVYTLDHTHYGGGTYALVYGNCTKQVFCTPVQTSICTGTGVMVVDTTVYTCDHTYYGGIHMHLCIILFVCTVQSDFIRFHSRKQYFRTLARGSVLSNPYGFEVLVFGRNRTGAL